MIAKFGKAYRDQRTGCPCKDAQTTIGIELEDPGYHPTRREFRSDRKRVDEILPPLEVLEAIRDYVLQYEDQVSSQDNAKINEWYAGAEVIASSLTHSIPVEGG